MKSPFAKKYVVDLFGQKASYIDSGRENLRLSNEMSGRFQTLIATIILAQLAFLGTFGFDHDYKTLSASAVSCLVMALLIQMTAVSWQQVGVVNAAKYYFKQAERLSNYIKSIKQKHVETDQFPEELRIDENILGYTRIPNRLLIVAYALGVAGTTLLLLLIWSIVL